MTYNQYDIVVIPFPFVDSPSAKPRPAVVLCTPEFQKKNKHIHVGMITTATHTKWADDVNITDLHSAGLPQPSVFRPKLFTLPVSLIKKKIGGLSTEDKNNVSQLIQEIF